MGLIRVLDDLVANQIAAGEVVERPASVVKELIENALDAGARQIVVHVEGGGLGRIDVQDDGTGIADDDVELAFIRHATSKLRTLADLERAKTLGFRGEALPSIAAVAKVILRTRTAASEAGLEVRVEGGRVIAREVVGCAVGTRVSVSDLFFNTPARLKFVRALQTEAGHVTDVVMRAALARPDVAFILEADGKRRFATPGDGVLATVFHAVYGLGIARRATAVVREGSDYAVAGLIGAPQDSRATRQAMWFGVNGRPVRSVALSGALLHGYRTSLPKGRFPVCYLEVRMDPGLLDVNVHPGKLEVRFSEERDVVHFVTEAVQEAFSGGGFTQSWDLGAGNGGLEEGLTDHSSQPNEWRSASRDAGAAPQTTGNAPRTADAGSRTRGSAPPDEWRPSRRETGTAARTGGSEFTRQQAFFAQEPLVREPRDAGFDGNSSPPAAFMDPERVNVSSLRAVAQVLRTFIVAEDGDAVYLIDQHAAHERVLYERFRAQVRARGARSLELLVPFPIELRSQDVDSILLLQSEAQTMGLAFERFGESALLIRSIPEIWEGLDEHRLVQDTFSEWLDSREHEPYDALENRVILRACKAAVKANEILSLTEMDALLRSLETLERPFTCPHGRPTAVRLSRAMLLKEFKRT